MILIYRFSETISIAIGKFLAATSCSYLQQPSLSPAPHLPNSPSPKSRRPGGRGRRGPAGSRWCCTSSPVTTLLCCPTGVNRLSVVPHRRADRSCGSSTLEADWLQLRTASVKIDLQQPRSEVNLVNLYVKFWAGLGWAGPGWAGYLLYKA